MSFTIAMNSRIVILTGMIQSGKSEALLDWIQNKVAAGFLTPTICGRKMLYDVADRRYHPYELKKKPQIPYR